MNKIIPTLVVYTLVGILCSHGIAGETAPIMPLASRSLLLDITSTGDRLIVAGERGHILYSDDNGGSWQQSLVATTQMLTGIHFVDSKHGWAVGHDGLVLVSDDAGENWRVQRDGLAAQQQTNLRLREQAHQRIAELQQRLQASDEVIPDREELEIALEDAQFDLEDADIALAEAVFTAPLMDVWFQDINLGWAVGAFGTLITTTNGGQQWQDAHMQLDNPDEFHLNTVTGDGNGRIFVAGEGGVIYRSLNNGESWETLPPFYNGSWFGSVYSAAHDALLIFGLRGNLYRSTDFGTSFSAVANDSHLTLAGGNASADGNIVLAGGVGTVLQSADGGLTFQRNAMPDRLSLSSGMSHSGKLILVGQGGVKTLEPGN